MRFPPSLLDEIRARLPVSAVVSRRVALKRQGREFIGLSPFKTEKTPSFTVNDQKGFYHCFASGEHGDIFKFVMQTEGLTFPEVVERLAGEAGVPMPKLSFEAEGRENERDRLLEVVEAACRFFERRLAERDGAGARAYLARRGVAPALQKRFRMGFAPDSRSALKDELKRLGFSAADVAQSGMAVSGDDIPAPYDRFRDRLIIPITDLRDRVVAFGGRALAEAQKPKYLNSPETPLFHKGHLLFNAARARGPAHDAGTAIVVEGYMDVVAMVGAGIGHVVAPLGTALTPEQIGLLWRFGDEPILCFDGDAAGRKAAYRAVDTVLPLLAPGRSLRFAFLPDGVDPDDLIRAEGAGAMTGVLKSPMSLIDVLWMRERDRAPTDTPERRAALEKRVADLVRGIADAAVRDAYGRELRQIVKDHQWQAVRALGTRAGAVATSRRDHRQLDWRTRARGSTNGRPRPEVAATAGDDLRRSRMVQGAGHEIAPREALLVLTMLNHPALILAHAEDIAEIEVHGEPLRRLKEAALAAMADAAPLDSAGLAHHLSKLGLEDALSLVARANTHRSDRFAEPDAPPEVAAAGFRHLLALQRRRTLERELKEAESTYFRDESEAALDELTAIRRLLDDALALDPDLVRETG